MAGIVLKVEKGSISADCLTLTIDDNTGVYDAGTNTGGYGSPNDERNTLYLKLLVTLKKTAGDEVITVDAYNDLTVTTWDVTIAEDGRYELFLFACLIYAGGRLLR